MPRSSADLVLYNGRIWTQDPERPWAQALAAQDGEITVVGSNEEVRASAGEDATARDLQGAFVMPGLVDGHVHLHLGGAQAAYELPILPTDDVAAIAGKVRAWRERLSDGEWVVGGIVGSTVMDRLGLSDLAVLDEAAGAHPVLLRDDSMHNRWVSSRALELMGLGDDSPDPEGGHLVREGGRLTGVLHENASALAEKAFAASVSDLAGRVRGAMTTGIGLLNSYGITAVQDAATMQLHCEALHSLEEAGELTGRVVLSTPTRPFIEEGVVGEELIEIAARAEGELVHPTFVKVVMDGVPMTRTSAMLEPYICHHAGQEGERGESYWTLDDLVAQLRRCAELGLGAKVHATGDAAARRVLDAAEVVRAEGATIPIHVAHAEYISHEDLPRFARLDVVADFSPYLWFPSVIQESIAEQVPSEVFDQSWPARDLLDGGARIATGSDWPCAAPSPDPWVGLQALVTRRNPDPAVDGALAPEQALTVEEALTAFTTNPAVAMGLGERIGRLAPGYAADVVVLNQNLLEVEPEQIHRTRPVATYVGGRLVYEA